MNPEHEQNDKPVQETVDAVEQHTSDEPDGELDPLRCGRCGSEQRFLHQVTIQKHGLTYTRAWCSTASGISQRQ